MHCLGQCSFTVQVDEFEHSLCSVLDILQQCSTVWWDDPHYVGTEAGCVMCHCVTYCPHSHHNRQQVPTSHNISPITNNTTPSWAAVRGGCWLLLTAGLVCSVQGVHCTVCQHRQPALYCTVLYSTHVLCTPHSQYTGHQPPFPYTAGFKLKISVNGHKLNYNSNTEGWL